MVYGCLLITSFPTNAAGISRSSFVFVSVSSKIKARSLFSSRLSPLNKEAFISSCVFFNASTTFESFSVSIDIPFLRRCLFASSLIIRRISSSCRFASISLRDSLTEFSLTEISSFVSCATFSGKISFMGCVFSALPLFSDCVFSALPLRSISAFSIVCCAFARFLIFISSPDSTVFLTASSEMLSTVSKISFALSAIGFSPVKSASAGCFPFSIAVTHICSNIRCSIGSFDDKSLKSDTSARFSAFNSIPDSTSHFASSIALSSKPACFTAAANCFSRLFQLMLSAFFA